MRRTHLRRHDNILKRTLVHVAGFNLGLLMRQLVGIGKPRCLQGSARRILAALTRARRVLWPVWSRPALSWSVLIVWLANNPNERPVTTPTHEATSATGC